MPRKRIKNKKCRRKIKLFRVLIVLFILCLVGFGIAFLLKKVPSNIIAKNYSKYLASDNLTLELYNYNSENKEMVKEKDIVRGIEVKTKNKKQEVDNKKYIEIVIDEENYYVLEDNIVEKKDSIVLEKDIYIRTTSTILEDSESSKIAGLAKKGQKVSVLGFDNVNDKGIVNLYKIKDGDVEGYIYGKYISFNEEEAKQNYDAEKNDPIHSKIKNNYGGGNAIDLDFYPYEKPNFEDNKMPEAVYALYLNCGSNVIENVDTYIEFAKDTNINTFVVDIKDNQTPAYPSEVFKEMSPSNYEHAINSYDTYKEAITKLKNAGFYVVGRITTFKDTFYIDDHPEVAISSKSTGKPYYHTGAYWPSPYDRNVWYYTVSLAKEAVKEFGFNEINFDYVRFPDRMQSVENVIDMHNTYEEDKTQAIQRFVMYACDELHKLGVYVSIDVFGESTNGYYTTAYGQYWPALSNIADVMSGMPYPDHFSSGYYGIAKPWNNPYDLMFAWGSEAYKRQEETTTPAKVRTWIQAYDVLSYVDANGINYNAKEVEEEIRGLYKAKLMDGYITWMSSSNIEKYKLQKKAFQIDYYKEYNE